MGRLNWVNHFKPPLFVSGLPKITQSGPFRFYPFKSTRLRASDYSTLLSRLPQEARPPRRRLADPRVVSYIYIYIYT